MLPHPPTSPELILFPRHMQAQEDRASALVPFMGSLRVSEQPESIESVRPEWEWVQPDKFVDGQNGVLKIGRGSRARVWKASRPFECNGLTLRFDILIQEAYVPLP